MKTPGEARRQVQALAGHRLDLAWMINGTVGLLEARAFVAHSIAQEDAISVGRAALFVVHPRSGESMLTTPMAVSNARMICDGRERIEAVIEDELGRDEPGSG